MSMFRLAFMNFKNSMRNYLSLIFSLAFTVLILYNFQNLISSGVLDRLGAHNAEYVEIILQTITFVLGCFMFFFVWYSTNVFLTKRKKEIGIYIFTGLTNERIGKLYVIETLLIGGLALTLGLAFGILTTRLFQMMISSLSDLAIQIGFQISFRSILITSGIYGAIYMIFVIKGYVSIVRSSVLDMISASRQNEYVHEPKCFLIVKAILGTALTLSGCLLAVKEGGMEVMGNLLLSVILVVVGIYFLFGGLIPLIFQTLSNCKKFLYQKERCLWINNMIFRIRKNYRTHAMVSVLLLCSVTALAAAFAMQARYKNIIQFRNMYTYQVLGTQDNLNSQILSSIEQDNDVKLHADTPLLIFDTSLIETLYKNNIYSAVPYSRIKQLAKETGIPFNLPEPADNEFINLSNPPLMSFITAKTNVTLTLNHKTYHQIAESYEPYLGIFEEQMSFYVMNDTEYERLRAIGQEAYLYNYQIHRPEQYQASTDELEALIASNPAQPLSYVAVDPKNSDIEWIKVLFSVCLFMFLVFVCASGSILFMKLYNDAFDDRAKYEVLQKLGFSKETLQKAIQNELRFTYMAPFLIMTVGSYFAVLSLSKLMQTPLLSVNLLSVLFIFIILYFCYRISIVIYIKNSQIRS